MAPDGSSTSRPDLGTRIGRVAALDDPVRRALYRWVTVQPDGGNREDAAAAIGVAVHTAKFHLDRLVADGLLDASYQRPPGRGGPGAGRPAKVYRARHGELDVSVPERRYDLAGRLLVKAVARSANETVPVRDALASVARDEGRAAGFRAVGDMTRPGRARVEEAVVDMLREDGYEPSRQRGGLILANCPFHVLVDEDTDVVCGMNLAFLEGVLEGAGAGTMSAVLDPAEGRCCVRIRTGVQRGD